VSESVVVSSSLNLNLSQVREAKSLENRIGIYLLRSRNIRIVEGVRIQLRLLFFLSHRGRDNCLLVIRLKVRKVVDKPVAEADARKALLNANVQFILISFGFYLELAKVLVATHESVLLQQSVSDRIVQF